MDIKEITYLLPYLGSLGLSLGVLFYVWKRLGPRGSLAYLWSAGAESLYIIAYIIELITPGLRGKIFWDGIQWLAAAVLLASFPAFVVQYTEFKIKHPRYVFSISLFVPAAFSLLVVTDSLHHWIYLNSRIISSGLFPALIYDYSPFVVIFAVYSYALTFASCALLFIRFIRPHKLFRGQIATIAVGLLIPILGTVFPLLGIQVSSERDITPFTAAIGNIIIAYGFYRFRIFEVTPIARDKVFEAMVEPVVILDNQNRIVDINTAMLDLLGRSATTVIGEPAKEVFENFPIPIKMYTHVSYARAEATFQIAGRDVYYEMTVWPLYDKQRQMTGRIYISHDITALKELERELRELNVDLEQRVHTRTQELAEAYDTTLEGWARTLELRDKETEGHSRRVTEITIKVARALEIPEDEIVHIRRGAILHDIGKMAIPDEILRKQGTLTHEERAVIQQHPDTARQLLEPIPFLRKALDIPYCHHEKWDGTGYPQGLKRRAIPVSARIFAIVDVWDAVQSDRPYKSGWSREQAIEYLKEQSGCHFDPRITDVFLRLVEKGEI